MTASRAADEIRDLVLPLVAALGCRLYDVELSGSGRARTLRVLIDRDGGVDLDAITAVTHAVSPRSTTSTAISGSFLLEVSSPGLERTLRRPAHYAGAIGETVSVKFHTDSGPERVHGALVDVGRARAASSRSTAQREEIAYDDDHPGAHRLRVGPAAAPAAKARRSKRAACEGEAHEESRDARSAVGARDREGDLRGDHARGAGERARHRVQAHARRGRGSARRDRRRDRRDPRDRAGARRRGQRHPRVGRHARRLRPHRRADGEAGDPAAHPRGRARDEVRGVRRPRRRHRHRHHPADRRPLHAARPRPGRGAAAAGRAGPRRPLRPRRRA